MESTKSHGLPNFDSGWSPSTRRKTQFPLQWTITNRNKDVNIARDSSSEQDKIRKKTAKPCCQHQHMVENSTSILVESVSCSSMPMFPKIKPVHLPGLSCLSSAEKSLSRLLNLVHVPCSKTGSLKPPAQEADTLTQPEKNMIKRSAQLNRNDSPIFNCELCEKKFLSRSGYLRHLQVHAGNKPFICCECGMAFLQSRDLTIHMWIHSGEKPHICSLCGASFTQFGSLTKHMWIHAGARPFVCSVCGQTFSNSSYLNVHRRTHTGEQPFKCPDCGKAFPQPSDLKRHKSMHVGNKTFCCSVCTKTFSRSTDLTRHEQMHSG